MVISGRLIVQGEKAFLALPRRGALCDGHCLIMPVTNSSCSTKACDEDVFAEVTRFKQQLQEMFFQVAKQEVVFIEHVSPRSVVLLTL